MNRGALLIGGSAPAAVVLPPVVTPPTPTTSRTAAIAAALAPTPSRTYAMTGTWSDLRAQISTNRDAAIGAAGGMVNTGTDRYGLPLWWPKVTIPDGTYGEQFTGTPLGHIVGNVDHPEAVEFASSVFKGAAQVGGPGLLVEGITAHSIPGAAGSSDADGWYGLHLSPSNRLVVFHRCRFRPQLGAGVGMDGDPGSAAVFLDCDLIADVTPGATNMHGTIAGAGLVVAFIDCRTQGVEYSDNGTGNADQVWVQGGVCPSVSLSGQHTVGHLDPDVIDPATVTLQDGATIVWEKTLPALPASGMLRTQDTAYYGSPVTTAQTTTAGTGATSNGSPVAGRTYYLPIGVTGAKVATKARITTATAAGGVIAGLATDNAGRPGAMFDLGGNNTLTAGGQDLSIGYPAALFRGDGQVWLALTFDTASASVAGVTTAGAYYQDGGCPARGSACTPVVLPSGWCPTGALT